MDPVRSIRVEPDRPTDRDGWARFLPKWHHLAARLETAWQMWCRRQAPPVDPGMVQHERIRAMRPVYRSPDPNEEPKAAARRWGFKGRNER